MGGSIQLSGRVEGSLNPSSRAHTMFSFFKFFGSLQVTNVRCKKVFFAIKKNMFFLSFPQNCVSDDDSPPPHKKKV